MCVCLCVCDSMRESDGMSSHKALRYNIYILRNYLQRVPIGNGDMWSIKRTYTPQKHRATPSLVNTGYCTES